MQPRNRDISYADMGVVTSAYVELQSVDHIDNVDDLTSVRTDRLKHNVI